MNRSAICFAVSMLVLGGLMFIMVYADRHLNHSLVDTRLHLTRSLRQEDMPPEQVSALASAIDDVGQDVRLLLIIVYIPMALLISMAWAQIDDNQRRLKRLESKLQQPSPTLEPRDG